MSQKTRGRYRRYLEPNSTDQVPKQTLSSIAKRAKTRSASKVVAPNKQAATIVCAKDSPVHRTASVSEDASRDGNLSMLPDMAASCLDDEPPMPYASNTCERDERDEDECSVPAPSVAMQDVGSETEEEADHTQVQHDSEGDSAAEDCDTEQFGLDDAPEQYFLKLSKETLPSQSTTKAEALLLILAYVVSAGLTWAQIRGLLILINALLGSNVVPGSTYFFRKLWKDKKELIKLHFFCHTCHEYLGKFSRSEENVSVTCQSCGMEKTLQSLKHSGSFFLMFDMRQRMLDILKNVGGALLQNLQLLASRRFIPGTYSDITDGDLYRSIRKQFNMSWSDLTLCFNTDGAPVFESSKYSIWPIQILLNELPAQVRWQNIAIGALWFSKVHPPMHLFIGKFVEELANIGTLTWSHGGRRIKSAVHAVTCCVDSPARAAVLNMKQFNGYFGCSWCLERGTAVEGTLKYLCHAEPAPERTHEGVFKAMLQAVHQRTTVAV
ncbi:uncharacterized protein [Dermacentor andersoni]|uniref:uncharacterized protein n=1 Tax=Dermacentor andersoni TaxID=34620 RepID=UPI002417D2E3|nr:uncharacterized protein LOC126522653 [Dermacentor andersoni]